MVKWTIIQIPKNKKIRPAFREKKAGLFLWNAHENNKKRSYLNGDAKEDQENVVRLIRTTSQQGQNAPGE